MHFFVEWTDGVKWEEDQEVGEELGEVTFRVMYSK
jgi:hypothetical protein